MNCNHEETHVPPGPVTAALISQGELGDTKDREPKRSEEEKLDRKKMRIYKNTSE